jgi:parallel beta-helix repeat protein
MPKGYWIHVSTHVKINRLGYADGYLETFVNGVMVSKMTGLKTRSLTQGKDFGKFERFIMSFFFGGEHTPCYASPRNQYVQMDNLVVYKYKPGAVNYSRAAKNIGQSCSMISPLQNSFSPDHLMVDESYTNASDTIFDVGNNKFYLYWPPYNKNVITKTVTRPTGANISYTFLSEEFGYPDYGESCEMWVKAYRGIGASKTLISTYGRTGINNGRDPGFVNPSGTYNSGTNTMTFEFHVGCNGGNTRGVAIKYDSKLALCFIGNSTMVPIYNKFVSDAEPYIMTNLAVSGHYINQQLSAWNALSTAQKQSFDYILLQIGLNDCVANDSNTTAAAYQNLVDAIVSSKKASCKIIAATLTPAKGSTVDDDKWLAINRAIRGEGSNAISGIDIIMTSNTTSLDANGDMIMDAAYNSGDNIHPNTAGQAVIKNNWVLTLTNPDLYARSYFVSPSGNDNNPGSFALPWATWDKAFNARKPGDKVYFRGGVYYMTVAGSTGYDRDVVGTSSDSIVFLNYPNEVPILDCDNVTPTPSTDHHALTLHLTYARIRGLVVRNVWQVYPSVEVQALTIVGDHAVVDNCTVYNTHGRGFWIVNSDNTILRNCDSYNNCDSLTAALPGNDGYGFFIQDQEVNTRIVTLIGCRASFCGDDGFTCYSESRVDFKGCWAFNNGQMEGEGHGFKLGWLNTEYSGLRRVVTNCLAANNLSDGINTNDEPGVSAAAVMNVFNNTSYNNTTSSVGGDAYGYIIFNTGSIDARELGRVFRNNLSYANTAGNVFLGEDGLYTHTYNNWDLSVTVNNSDFTSLDAQYLDDSRSSDGDLPNTHGFMELVSGSDLINAGTNVSLPYLGTAPDLGYKEKQ